MNGEITNLIGRVLGGRYRIVRAIGAGGMGTVFEAEQLGLDRRVAVKVLKDTDPRALARLRQEALTAGAIRNPHVVAVFDFQTNPGEPPFVVMELLEGEPLSMLLRRERALLPARAARIASHVLAGLDAAHRAGVIHRDIKPSNIWLSRSLADEVVKLLDFGIVKTSSESSVHTTTGSLLGTPGYFSPEQLRGMPLDARSDLHAIGVVLFEMLAGRKPWSTETPVAIAEILNLVPPPLSSVVAGVPPRLSDVVARALAKEPAARFASAAEMLAALAPFAQPSGSLPFVANAHPIEAETAVSSRGGAARGQYVGTDPPSASSAMLQVPPRAVPLLQSAPPPAFTVAGPSPANAYPGPVNAHLAVAPAAPRPRRSPLLPVVVGVLLLASLAGGGALYLVRRDPGVASATLPSAPVPTDLASAAAPSVTAPPSATATTGAASALATATPVSPTGAAAPASPAVGAVRAPPAGTAAPASPAGAAAPAAASSQALPPASDGGAPATSGAARASAPRKVTPADPVACTCLSTDEGPRRRALCTAPPPPECQCMSDGYNLCAARWPPDGSCSTKDKIAAFSGSGKKNGAACSGFMRSSTDGTIVAATGKLDCNFCYGADVDRVAPDQSACRGVDADGGWHDGKWSCKPR